MQTPIDVVLKAAAQSPHHIMAEAFTGELDQENKVNEGDTLLPGSSSPIVLVVDDSLTERANLARIIQAAGYQVITAGSGNEAVALALQYQPVAIFLDIIMDDGDGYKACRSIRRNAETTAIPVIMVSSKSNAVDQKWAEKLGANRYVVKPYSDDEILSSMEDVFSKQSQQ